MLKFSQTELAWAAGFFDGEGCTYCYLKPRRQIGLKLEQNYYEPLERWKYALYLPSRIISTKKQTYVLQVQKFELVQYCVVMLWEYLCEVKQDQAAKALKTYHTSPTNRLTGNQR